MDEPSAPQLRAFAMGKALYFLSYATVGAVSPYLSVFLSNVIGLPSSKLGAIGAVTPIMAIFSTPQWGSFADRTGKHETIMVVNHIVSVALRSMMLAVAFAWKEQASILAPLVVALSAFFMAPMFSILDDVTFQMARNGHAVDSEAGGSWAKLRLFGSLGYGVGAKVTGSLIGSFGYGVSFAVSAALAVPTAALMLAFRTNTKVLALAQALQDGGKGDIKGKGRVGVSSSDAAAGVTEEHGAKAPLLQALQACTHQSFLGKAIWVSILVCGMSYGFLEVFLFPLMSQRSIRSTVMGNVRLVNAVMALPFYYWAGPIINTIGVAGGILGALLAYAFRLVFHSCCDPSKAGLIIAVECLYGITGGLMWSSAASFAQAQAAPGTTASMMGLLNAAHFGIGMGLGSYFGGIAAHRAGSIKAFQAVGAINLLCSAPVALGLALRIRLPKMRGPDSLEVSDDMLLGKVGLWARRKLKWTPK
ncbi:unnamed protein product [Chrysoparadoxa australica]